jgi:hypothetical protein
MARRARHWHSTGAPNFPQTQGKIELASDTHAPILIETYYLAWELEAQIDGFVGQYNHRRY